MMRSLSFGAAGLAAVGIVLAGAACSSFTGEAASAEAGLEGGIEAASSPDAAEVPKGADPDASPRTQARELASGFTDLTSVVASETTAYFVARAQGVIGQVALDGNGAVAQLYKASPLDSPSNTSLLGGSLYWVDRGNSLFGQLSIVAGGPDVRSVANGVKPVAIAAGKGTGGVRMVIAGHSGSGEGNGRLQQYKADSTLLLEIDGTYNGLFDVAVTGTHVWWTESGAGAVWEGTLDAQAASSPVSGETGCESIAADAQGVYWTRRSDGLVRMLPPEAPPVAITLAKSQMAPFSVTSDASGVYWLTSDGKLQRSNRQSSEVPPQTIAKGFSTSFPDMHIRGIALTSKFIVWITSDGKILRADK